jgi:pantothenate kinase
LSNRGLIIAKKPPIDQVAFFMGVSFMHDLIQHLKTYLASDSQNTLWIGLAGAPGSGKSTLAAKLQAQFGDSLLVIPQDGYHYYRHQLDAMPDPAMAHARRGSPLPLMPSVLCKS